MLQASSPPEPERVALISDVHANAGAFAAALDTARKRGFDQLLILGDLLTYGCGPREILDLAQEAVRKDGAILIKGNHDQLYMDLVAGDRAYYDGLPPWLRETVDWTYSEIGATDIARDFDWRTRYVTADMFYAHANPFPYGDWTYLNGSESVVSAARTLRLRGKAAGVFGHTHRERVFEWGPGTQGELLLRESDAKGMIDIGIAEEPDRQVIVTVGSAGQPRDRAKVSSMMFLTRTRGMLHLESVALDYDVAAHCRAILQSELSEKTKEKLLGYIR